MILLDESQELPPLPNWQSKVKIKRRNLDALCTTTISQVRKSILRRSIRKVSRAKEMGSCYWPQTGRATKPQLEGVPSLSLWTRRNSEVHQREPPTKVDTTIQIPFRKWFLLCQKERWTLSTDSRLQKAQQLDHPQQVSAPAPFWPFTQLNFPPTSS